MTAATDLFQTNPENIAGLLMEIENGKLALPEFQRDFIWAPENTARLLSSVIAKYPAGSLLAWRPKSVELESRPVTDAPPASESTGQPERLILDGQQRLTALYRALKAKTEESYFLAIDEFIDVTSFESIPPDEINWDNAVVSRSLTAKERSDLKRKQVEPEHHQLEWQLNHYRFPIGENFDDWMDGLVERAIDEDDRDKRKIALRQIRDNYLGQLNNYRFPVITLTDSASLAAVCSIFEKLNTNSVRLGPFEILAAKFFREDLNLRKLWTDARNEHSVLRDPKQENDHSGFSIDPYLVLQIVTLIIHKSPQRKAVLSKLTAQDVKSEWPRVILNLKRVIEWLRDNCGIIHRDLLPYQAILVPLTGAWIAKEELKGAKKTKALEKITQYFWSSIFTTNFDQGGASQAEKDYRDLIDWLNDEKRDGRTVKPEAVGTLPITSDSLLSATTKKKALLQGLMALTVQAGAKDFHKGLPLTPAVYVEAKVNSHHLYPKARLADESKTTGIATGGYSPELILNRALIDAETNRRIGSHKPSRYVGDIREAEADVEALFESHLVEVKSLESDDYPTFLTRRLTDVVAKIEALTGKKVEPLQVSDGDGSDDQPAKGN